MNIPHVYQERMTDVETLHTEVQIRCGKCMVRTWVDDLKVDWWHNCTSGLWHGVPRGDGEPIGPKRPPQLSKFHPACRGVPPPLHGACQPGYDLCSFVAAWSLRHGSCCRQRGMVLDEGRLTPGGGTIIP